MQTESIPLPSSQNDLWDGRPIRLLGIRTLRLSSQEEPVQLSIFDLQPPNPYPQPKKEEASLVPSPEKLKKLDAAMDSIRQKYGTDAVVRGCFLKS